MIQEMPKSDQELASFMPKEILGWKAEGEDALYDPQTIFDYIDGAGEVYRSYNFRLLLARHYVKEGKSRLIADLFDMGTSSDAFGVFTHDLMGENAGIGQGSTYKGGLLSFWKDRFFVSVYAEEENPETKQAVLALGKWIDSAIKSIGKKPALLAFLPPINLNEKEVHYFHNHLILNYHFFVADENILHLNEQTDAVLAPYGDKGERSYLLLVGYPDVAKSLDAYQSFTQAFMPDASEPGLVRTEDAKWTVAVISKNFVVVYFHAPSREAALEMMAKVDKKIVE